jgi:hypothetical protein
MPKTSREKAEPAAAYKDRLSSHSDALFEQWRRRLSEWQDYSGELASLVDETAKGDGHTSLTKLAVDSTCLTLSFVCDQWKSWIDFTSHCASQVPPGARGSTNFVLTPTIVFHVDQFSEACDPQPIAVDVSKFPDVAATELRAPGSAVMIPESNVRLTTLGSKQGYLYVSLVDLQSLLSPSGSSRIPPGTYVGSIESGSTLLASIEVIFQESSCA